MRSTPVRCRSVFPMGREKLPPGACVFCRGTGEDKPVNLLDELLKIEDSDLFDKTESSAHSGAESRGGAPRSGHAEVEEAEEGEKPK